MPWNNYFKECFNSWTYSNVWYLYDTFWFQCFHIKYLMWNILHIKYLQKKSKVFCFWFPWENWSLGIFKWLPLTHGDTRKGNQDMNLRLSIPRCLLSSTVLLCYAKWSLLTSYTMLFDVTHWKDRFCQEF